MARLDGRAAGCLLIIDHDGNADVEMVAVVPEARGHGIAGKLLAHALADAAERGLETSTLLATRLGRPVYERLGYREFGTLHMWERKPGLYLSSIDSSNMTSPSSVRCTGHLAAICISFSRCSSGSSFGSSTAILKRVNEPRWAGS